MGKKRSRSDIIAQWHGKWTKRFARPLPHPYRRPALLALTAVAMLPYGGTATAITSPAFTYSAPRTAYLFIHPMELSPMNSASTDNYSVGLYLTVGPIMSCFGTGVNLPQGAILRAVRIYYRSGTPSNGSASFYRTRPGTNAFAQLAARELVDDSGSHKSLALAVPSGLSVVRNDLFAYSFSVCVGPEDVFEGARITYTYRSAGS